MITLSISLGTLLLITSYIVFNLLRKTERMEDIIEDQVGYLQKVSYLIKESRENLDKLDSSGHFQVDDELGTFFGYIKQIQETADSFTLPDDYGQKEK